MGFWDVVEDVGHVAVNPVGAGINAGLGAVGLSNPLTDALSNPAGAGWDYLTNRDGARHGGQQAPMVNTAGAQPVYGGWTSAIGADGKLPGTMTLEGPRSSSALDQYRDRAMAKGNSPWASAMLDKNKLMTGQAIGDASSTAMASRAAAAGQLGRSGGLDSGARTSIARQGMRDRMLGTQKARLQGNVNSLDILGQDDSKKIDMLGKTAGWDLDFDKSRMAADQFNIGNILADKKAQEEAKLRQYEEQMKGWTGSKMADATVNAGNMNKGPLGLW